MDEIDISVIVLTCNRTERFQDSLEVNQAELEPFRTEWWVVNNGSEPIALPPNPPAPTRLIQMPRNGGTAARNAVLGKAAGSCILMIDDDAYIKREAITAALDQLRNHAHIGGIILPVENEGCLLPTIFHGCSVLLSTAALEAVGGYPTDYLYYGEEYEVSFKLAAAGFPLLTAEPGLPETKHVRDSNGRSKNRILYRLVRNNTCCWARSLPLHHLRGALYDTIHRYHFVSIKEKSRRGYLRGLLSIPAALIRGLFSRHALDEEAYGEISLNTALRETLVQLKEQEIEQVAFCGLGKFPSGWLERVEELGLKTVAFLDQNTAFLGQCFRGIPIEAPEALDRFLDPETALIAGTTSAPANQFWQKTLEGAGFKPCTDNPQVQAWIPGVES